MNREAVERLTGSAVVAERPAAGGYTNAIRAVVELADGRSVFVKAATDELTLSDNLCFADGRCVLVDWNHTSRGNPDLDLALWQPSLRLEGGPEPEGLPELAAAFAGYLACRAGLPEPPTAPPHGVRPVQIAQLEIALAWAARELGLSRPHPR